MQPALHVGGFGPDSRTGYAVSRSRPDLAQPSPRGQSTACDAEVRPGLSPATTTMSHCGGQDHGDVTSPWFRRPGQAQDMRLKRPVWRSRRTGLLAMLPPAAGILAAVLLLRRRG